jgi:hypothetical protein
MATASDLEEFFAVHNRAYPLHAEFAVSVATIIRRTRLLDDVHPDLPLLTAAEAKRY